MFFLYSLNFRIEKFFLALIYILRLMNGKDKDEKAIKVILLGESGVGKTSIIRRYINNEFSQYSESTLGTNFLVKEIVKKNIIYRLIIL